MPWRGGSLALPLRLRCVCCVAWRLRFVVLRAVALRPRRSCSVSGGCSLPRLAAPCCSVLRRAQNRHFCALFGFGTPIFRPFEHKIGVFVSEWAIFQRFLVFLTQKWGFCARGKHNNGSSCKSPRTLQKCKFLITRQLTFRAVLGEHKLRPPRGPMCPRGA